MTPILKFTLSLILLVFAYESLDVISTEDDFVKCQSTTRKWAASSMNEQVKEDKHTLQDLLFFLHVPRTGGRTYFHCFLRKLYASYLECPRSYDKLRFDPSKPDCRLMVTHDDYSMMSRLPKERTSVVTVLRDPVDRVLSTYEFSVEVAARFLVHPNLTSATQMTGRIRPKTNGVSTLDIWPWKYLVPWMRQDLFARRDARKRGIYTDFKKKSDPYNLEGVVMPLHEFINDAVAHEIIHNGATLQVAGLTNNSCLEEAHVIRSCLRKHRSLGKYVLEVAKKRLDDMLYVGLTEDHKGSATMFADVVGGQVLSQLQALNIKKATYNETEPSASFKDSEQEADHLLNSTNVEEEPHNILPAENVTTKNETKTVGQLMEAYEMCISSLRKSQARRRIASLKRVAPANFTKEKRLEIPEMVMKQIRLFNDLDVELYKHAQHIFSQQQQGKRLMQERELNIINIFPGSSSSWIMMMSDGPVFLLVVVVLFVFMIIIVKARRTSLKLKI